MIDGQPLTRASGKVTLSFHLNYDGTITEMQVLNTTVSGLLAAMCQRAVLDPAPYGIGVRKDDVVVRDAMREALMAIIADGTYDEVLAKWDVSQGAYKTASINGG